MRDSLQGLRVVAFESRRAEEMAELIRRYGGDPIVAPSMREVGLDENSAVLDLLPQLERGQIDVLILMTGVGLKTLQEVLLTKYPAERIRAALAKTSTVARGPKPVAVLKGLGLQPSMTVPEPNTWHEVLAAVTAAMPVEGKRIVIQEYGLPNRDLSAALQSFGATVFSLPVYRSALPEDLTPLQHAVEKLLRGEVEVALFTNGAQVDHLFEVAGGQAADRLRLALKRIVVGSVGPVCSGVLEQFGIRRDIEPTRAKMGALIAEIAASASSVLAAKRGFYGS